MNGQLSKEETEVQILLQQLFVKIAALPIQEQVSLWISVLQGLDNCMQNAVLHNKICYLAEENTQE